jgi:hypothetical protein
MSRWCAGGVESEPGTEWEPEPYELPLVLPRPSRHAPPEHPHDESSENDVGSRVIVIDLA